MSLYRGIVIASLFLASPIFANEMLFYPADSTQAYSGNTDQSFCHEAKNAALSTLTFAHIPGSLFCSISHDGHPAVSDSGGGNTVYCGIPDKITSGTWRWSEKCE